MSNVLSRAAVVAALSLSVLACSEHADVALTPAQQKKVEAAFVTAPAPQTKVDAVIDGQVRLIGYDIDKTELAPGETRHGFSRKAGKGLTRKQHLSVEPKLCLMLGSSAQHQALVL